MALVSAAMMNSWIESAWARQGNFHIGNTITHGLLILMEPDNSVRAALRALLSGEGWQVSFVESAESLASQLGSQQTVAVISESSLPGMDARHVLALCIEQQVPLIFTGHEQAVQQAVDLVQHGAADYLEKPFSQARLLHLLEQFQDRHNRQATRHT